MKLWDIETHQLVRTIEHGSYTNGGYPISVAFSPNGNYLVAGVSRYVSPEWGGLIRIWDMADGSLAREYTEETVGSVGSSLFVAVSPSADDWIAYTYDNKVKFAETGLDFGGLPSDLTSPVADTPSAFKLVGAVPNPFNPSTTISFVLPEEAEVTLRVYDVSGHLVKTLLAGAVQSQGQNEVVWNGQNESGRVVAAGVYLYRLDSGGYSETQRMTLVK